MSHMLLHFVDMGIFMSMITFLLPIFEKVFPQTRLWGYNIFIFNSTFNHVLIFLAREKWILMVMGTTALQNVVLLAEES